MKPEAELFSEFVAHGGETVFAEIVRLHVNFVFATALRLVGNRPLAEEVTQDVFLALARQAKKLKWDKTLAGWLYQTTLNQARMRLRSELRRSRWENAASKFSLAAAEGESVWATALPLLDEALLDLPAADRLALLLHYFEQKPYGEVGRVLGVGEDAARKRVDRTLDRLSDWFRKHGFTLPVASVAAGLAVESSQTATAALVSQIVAASTAIPVAGALTVFGLVMASTNLKIAGVVIIGALALSLRHRFTTEKPSASEAVVTPTVTKETTIPDNTSRSVSAIPRNSAIAHAAQTKAQSLMERINSGDQTVSLLTQEQAEAFLAKNKTNAESLVTAYQVTRNTNYLRQAAALYPNDPSVLLGVIGHDLFPEDRRSWLDRLKVNDPENALGYYFSAKDYLEKKDYSSAFKDLTQAAQKTAMADYYQDQTLGLEEIYLDAGHSAAEAKALSMSAVELPHLHQLRDTGRAMSALVTEYQNAGDNSSAESLIRYGLRMANQLETVPDGGMVLGDMVGLAMERNFTRQLDPNQRYAFLDGNSVNDRLKQFDQREKTIRANSEIFNQWIVRAPEQEMIVYFDRVKRYGEAATIEWLKTRAPEP